MITQDYLERWRTDRHRVSALIRLGIDTSPAEKHNQRQAGKVSEKRREEKNGVGPCVTYPKMVS